MVGVEKAFRRPAIDHLGQLPSQIHRILDARVEALPADWIMHVCGIAGDQDASLSVRRGLPRQIGESGNPSGTVNPVVGTVHGGERRAEIAQAGFPAGIELPLGHHHP